MEKPYLRIGVIGLGYVGLPLARLFVDKGHEVYGIDVDERKVTMLRQRKSYLSDFTANDIENLFEQNRFHVGSSYEVIPHVEVIIICIPTPLDENDEPDLQYVVGATQSLVPYLKHGQLVVLESSTFPGTTEELLKPILESSGLTVGKEISLAYSPERIDPGSNWELENIPKVVGGYTQSCLDYVKRVYGLAFKQIVPVSSLRAAEMTKLLENCQRFVNISFMNSLLKLSEALGVNLWEVIDAAGTKPFGFMKYYPGPGVGGHCIPVDPLYLLWKAKQHNLELPFVELSHSINQEMPNYIVQRLEKTLHPKRLHESRIFVIGVTYKKDVNDMRESSALKVIDRLLRCGVKVSYFDPYVHELRIGETNLLSTPITAQHMNCADCTLILTDHSSVPYDFVAANSGIVIDTRNATINLVNRKNIVFL